MDLKDTVELMLSDDYKDRFKAEYYQLKTRYEKLKKILVKIEADTLDFVPDCPIHLLSLQARRMEDYLHILEVRAEIEKIEL